MTLSAWRRKRSGYLPAEKPLDSFFVCGRSADLAIKRPANPCRLLPSQVALWSLGPQDLATTGYVKPALRAFMCLDLRHLVIGAFGCCAGSGIGRYGQLVRSQDYAE